MTRASLRDRFEARVDRSRGEAACHPWIGGYGQYGHPNFCVGKGSVSARRWLWQHLHGPIDRTKWVTNRCGNLSCVNPKHLTLRTHNDDVTRFWEKVEKTSLCWIWKGHLQRGYGVFSVNQNPVLAHRYSWELAHGPIVGHVPMHPELEICVCHTCDNPACVRPDHLFLGNDKANHDDMIAKRRHAHGPALADAVRRAHRRRGYTSSPELVQSARRLRGEGRTYAAIARELAVSEGRAWNMVNAKRHDPPSVSRGEEP